MSALCQKATLDELRQKYELNVFCRAVQYTILDRRIRQSSAGSARRKTLPRQHCRDDNGRGSGAVAVEKFAAWAVLAVALMAAERALADGDIMTVKAPPAPSSSYNWAGLYFGADLGYSAGRLNWSAAPIGTAAPAVAGSIDRFNACDPCKVTGGYFAVFHAGYNYQLPSRL